MILLKRGRMEEREDRGEGGRMEGREKGRKEGVWERGRMEEREKGRKEGGSEDGREGGRMDGKREWVRMEGKKEGKKEGWTGGRKEGRKDTSVKTHRTYIQPFMYSCWIPLIESVNEIRQLTKSVNGIR
jgi:hypothetical protein